jgi:hypothetical protein
VGYSNYGRERMEHFERSCYARNGGRGLIGSRLPALEEEMENVHGMKRGSSIKI